MEIDEEKKAYANRLFQCLAISTRPLRVKELAELFAVLPDAESGLGFKFNISRRPQDPEEFILSACSTLVTVVYNYNYDYDYDGDNKNVVQFSHFSVREYLTSDHIANSAHVSRFNISPTRAHTLLTGACVSVLIQLDYSSDIQNFPLAQYAAESLLNHALFGDVSSDIRDGLDCLFDKNKPHLAVWIWLYDVEICHGRDWLSPHPAQPNAVPLYHAVLCGLRDLAERLLDAHPQDVIARGEFTKLRYMRPSTGDTWAFSCSYWTVVPASSPGTASVRLHYKWHHLVDTLKSCGRCLTAVQIRTRSATTTTSSNSIGLRYM